MVLNQPSLKMKNRKKYFDHKVLLFHGVAFFLAVLVVFFATKDIQDFDFMMLFFLIVGMQFFVFMILTLPMLILKWNYEKHNKHLDFKMDLPNQKFLITNQNDGFVLQIPYEDIVEIHRIESHNKSFIHSGYMDFFYYELVLKSEESVVITCFLSDNLEKFLHFNKLKIITKSFPYISEYYEA
jgi:hypothetical protein